MSTATMIAEALPTDALRRTRNVWCTVRPAVLPMSLLAFGYAPLLILRGRLLLDCPHLSAFPLAVIAGGVLAWKGARGLGTLEPGSQARSVAVMRLALAMLIVAGFSAFSWLAVAAAMMTLLAGAYGIGGARLLWAVLPAWGLGAMALLTPLRLELWLIGRLQSLVTTCAGPVLDNLGVIHLTEGNMIRIASRSLLVEQACSGVSSLFAGVGVTCFYVVWTGRKFGPALALVLASACWVVLGNVARVVTVVTAAAYWEVDLASGWRHEMLGFLIFAVFLALTLSTDRLLQFLGAMTTIRLIWPGYYHGTCEDNATQKAAVAVSPPTQFADLGQTWLVSKRIGAVSVVLGLLQVVWLWPLLVEAIRGYSGPLPVQSLIVTLKSLSEGDLPDTLGPYRRRRFETKVRGAVSSFGEFSREWHYRSDIMPVTAAVDFPFRGWHELTQCYQGLGWTLKDRMIRPDNEPGSVGTGPCVEAVFERQPGRHAALIFGFDGQYGDEFEPPSASSMLDVDKHLDILRFARRRLGGLMDLGDQSMTDGYQVQLLIVTDTPLLPTQWTEARAIFAQVRREVRRRMTSRIGLLAKGGNS